jgi:hypothetical protein
MLLGIIGPGRISSDKTSRMKPPSVIPSTSTVAATAVMIAATAVTIAAEATGAGVTAGIAISITAGVGS